MEHRAVSQNDSPVRIDLLGYRPGDPKTAVVLGGERWFEVVRASDDTVAYRAELPTAVPDAMSGDAVALADFSAVKEADEYYLRTEHGRSDVFPIAEEVYSGVAHAALRFFYLQRCGMQLPEELAGRWAHPACHVEDVRVAGTGELRRCDGGWHDAGDYGRYVVAAAKTALDLLLSWRDHPGALAKDAVGILAEVRWGLEWMLTMQREDGGVYHKVTTPHFTALDSPPNGPQERGQVLSPVSATATGDFAGTLAYASLFYQHDTPFAARMLAAARYAFDWLEAHPDEPGFCNPEGVTTGQYGDDCDADERCLAAAALYAVTGEERYHAAMKRTLGRGVGLSWANVGLYPAVIYTALPQEKRDPETDAKARQLLLGEAEKLLAISKKDGYGLSLTRYYWGCNGTVADNANVLLLADRLSPNAEMRECALDHLHYLLGRNTNDICYVTGFGPRCACRPHHRLSVGMGAVPPGMLAGGPNPSHQDKVQQERYAGLAPAKHYVDQWEAYASNEVDTYWNSPLVYLLSAFAD